MVAHSLHHWKYALNTWVVGQLESDGHMTAEQLTKREKMKARKRRDEALGIVDAWEAKGIVRDLWKNFKDSLESAREGKQTRWATSRD